MFSVFWSFGARGKAMRPHDKAENQLQAGGLGGVQHSNPFGTPVQASPVNPFQGGRGNASGSSNGVHTSFGGGTASGGRGGGRHNNGFGGPTPPPSGGRGRGRGRGRGGRGGRGDNYAHGAIDVNPFGGAGSAPGSVQTTFGSAASTPSSAPQTPFGQDFTSNGRGGSGFGSTPGSVQTTFGGDFVTPPTRRRNDFGGRGSQPSATTFGGNQQIFPPLPPQSPPPLPPTPFGQQSAPGRGRGRGRSAGGRSGAPTPSASPVTMFGSGLVTRQRSNMTSSFAGASGGDNPFGSHQGAGDTPFSLNQGNDETPQTKTAFGRQSQPSARALSGRGGRDRRSPMAFGLDAQGEASMDEVPSGLEARMMGRNASRVNNLLNASNGDETAFAPRTRQRNPGIGNAEFSMPRGSPMGIQGNDAVQSTLKTRKKAVRATPQVSPSATPPMGSPVQVQGAMAQIGDDSNKAELASAQNLNGTCVDKCSPAERELHIRVDELSLFEKNFPGQPGMERELIVKRFQRSSADHKLDIPSEVRPPGVLRSTQLYLEQNIMDREKIGEDPRFNPPRLPEMIELYNFCWDRCRMIRKDFVLQNYRGAGGRVHPIVLDVHERIARYHILSEHELCEVPSFVAQQNMEQLGQTLKSLNELYDESRKIGDLAYLSPFEAEFRAYFILCTLDNGRGLDVLKFVKGLTPQIREAPQVKFAMKAFVARHTQDYYQFFYLLREATYLQSCLLFRYIPSMRSQALERMNRAYRKQPYPLEDLVDQLCFDDLDHAESVCTHHGLDIGQDENDGAILVNFGGDFETDIDLRKNKNPLPIRSSHVYVGQKQADCWRKDICRGVTEYTPEEYPALSKLVEDTEDLERARLYPDRPPYEDEYSMFSVYTADPYDSNRQAGDQNVNRTPASIRHPEGEATDQRHDLDDIAKRKAELEHTKQMMLQRLQQLEREKEAKSLQVQQKSIESQREAELEARAKAKAEEEALERQREQEAAALREQLLAKQREKQQAEEKRRKEEAKIAAEKAKADEQRRIAEQLRQAEEERVRREAALRAEEARRIAAEVAERRRQEELAAAEAKRKREAALEAQRQAQLARELELKKRAQRIQKQKLAILKLKFHQWRAYVAKSKEALAGVKVGTTQIISENSARPENVVEWLFGGRRAAADRIGLRRRQWLSTDTSSRWTSSRQWDPLNVVDIVEPSLFRANRASTGWKLLIADLLDEGISSFGSWSALKLGVSGASFDEDDRVSTVHYVQLSDSSIPICLRYLDASFSHSLSRLGQQKKLAGTSSILLPVDLSHVSTPEIFQRWEERVDLVFRNLHASSRVSLMVLAFCSADLHNKLAALTTVEEAIRKLQTRYAAHVNFVDGELVLEDDLRSADVVEAKVTNILVRLADHSTKSKTKCVTIGFADLLEIAVHNAFKRSMRGNVTEIQKQLHQQLSSLQDSLTSPEVLNVDIPIPELQDMVKLPAYGWNSSEAQAKRTRVLVAAMTLQLATDSTELRNDRVCEMYFHKIVEFIDKLFAVTRGSKSHISSDELKRNIYGLLLPIHEHVVAGDGGSVHERIPWQRILEKVYGAFVEEVDNMALYVPKDLPVFQEHNQEEPKHVQTSTTQGKKALDPNAVAAALAFAKSALKRTSTRHELDPEQKVGLKKLRQSIAQDRAAAQQFQHFLRRELHR